MAPLPKAFTVRSHQALRHCSTAEEAAQLMKCLQAEPTNCEATSAAAHAARLEALALDIQRSAGYALPTKELKTLKDFDYHVRHSGLTGLKTLSKDLRLHT